MAVETPSRVELEIGGMTCTSCAARVEKKLNKVDGVDASVNYATEIASVAYDPSRVALEELVRTVEATGYSAALPNAESEREDPVAPLLGGRANRPRRRWAWQARTQPTPSRGTGAPRSSPRARAGL